jgi:hypothetical protein
MFAASVCLLAAGAGCEDAQGPTAEAVSAVEPADTRVHAPVPTAQPSDEAIQHLLKEFRWDEFEQMIIVLKLPAEQEKAFRQNMADRGVKLAAFRATDLHKEWTELSNAMRAAQRAKDEAKIAELKPKHDPVAEECRAKMEDLRRIVLGPLSAAQRQYWCQWVLYRGLWRRFQRAKLTDEQKDRLWQLCARPAHDHTAGGYVGSDPYLRNPDFREVQRGLREETEADVLTAEQRAAMAARGR